MNSTFHFPPTRFGFKLTMRVFLGWFLMSFLTVCISANAAGWEYYANTGPVTCMAVGDGVVWCGTHCGLVRWDTTDMSHRVLLVPDGLPHASIVDIEIAADGSVWVATEKGGVASYDGERWRVHATENGLPDGNTYALNISRDGFVWCSIIEHGYFDFGQGISRWDGESWQTWKYIEDRYSEAPENMVYDLVDTSDERLWTVTLKDLAVFSDSSFTFPDDCPEYRHLRNGSTLLARVHVDGDDVLWLAKCDVDYDYSDGETNKTYFPAVYANVDGSWDNIALPDEFSASAFIVASPGHVNRYMIGKSDGSIAVQQNGTFDIITKGSDDFNLTTFTEDESGVIWGGLADGGLACFENGAWKRYSISQLPSLAMEDAITVDRNNTVWLLTASGVIRHDDESWNTVISSDAFCGIRPSHIFFDANNTLWLYGYNYENRETNLLYRDDSGTLVRSAFFEHWESCQVKFGDDGNVWYGIRKDGEFYVYRNETPLGTLSDLGFSQVYHADDVLLMDVDVSGGIWIATDVFYHYDGASWTQYSGLVNPDDYDIRISGFSCSPDGGAWATFVDNDGSTHWPIYSSRLYHLKLDGVEMAHGRGGMFDKLQCVDQAGRVWVSLKYFSEIPYYGYHANGVLLYDNGEATHFNEFNGLSSNKVYDVFPDHNNTIWILTDKGVCCYTDETTGVESDDADVVPRAMPLLAAYPNPFNPATMLSFRLVHSANVSLAVHNVAGQKVRTLFNGLMIAGEHRIRWDGCDDDGKTVASGVYVARIDCGGSAKSAVKMTLMR